ncbi:MAG: ABC transporter substrate-binding protein [Nitrospirota bacterium]|jgi:ABC-type transport system substrate-binding protein
MWTKRLMLLVPVIVVAVLLQSYLWVPTYERQTTGNPARLVRFIAAGIGDAAILNPILNADTASANIVDHCFDGLLDLDEELRLRGRLATGWTITERAAFPLPEGTGFAALRPALREALGDDLVTAELRPAQRVETSIPAAVPDGAPQPVTVDRLPYVALRLARVVPDLFARIEPLLPADALDGIDRLDRLHAAPEVTEEVLTAHLDALFPVRQEQPVIEFRLRPGVTFHDGHPFTAADVVFTWRAIMDPRNLSPRTSDFEPIADIEVVDPLRVRVVYKRLFSPAIDAWTMGILPEHLLNREALEREARARGLDGEKLATFGMRDSDFNRHPVGTGAFRFVSWESDEQIRLARNDDYWDGPPEYHEYIYRVLPDVFTQELEFRAGTIDSYGAEPHQVARYREDPNYQPFSRLGTGYTYIGYNLRKPLFQDVRVRKALGMAIDVETIIRYLLYGEGERVTGPYPKVTNWYDPDTPPLPYDPAAAAALLEDAGWYPGPDGIRVKDGRRLAFALITNHANPQRKAIGAIAQDAWRKIGVDCQFQLFEWAVFLKDFINTGEFDACILGWSMGRDFDLFQLWHSSQTGPQQLNFVGYKNAEADALIERLRREYDEAEQARLARHLHRLIAADAPYTFLYAPRGTTVLDRKIVVVERLPDGTEKYHKIKPIKTGEIGFYFNRWRKLAHTPEFAAD